MSFLFMSEEFPERKTEKSDGALFEFNKEGITMESLIAAATKVVDTRLDAGIELAARYGANPRHPQDGDSVHLHGVSLFRHALIFTELRHAIKFGDPGRMKALFPYLIPIFKATGKHKYANELLEVMARWKSEWSDHLRGTILGHSLVNQTGRPDGWIGIDLWQEHDVRLHKVDFPISESRGTDEVDLHHYISGILHTLRSAKTEFWKKLDIKTSSSKSRVLRSKDEIIILARMWNNTGATQWRSGRTSNMFEAYQGQLKDKYDWLTSEDLKVIKQDSLQKGLPILVSGAKSLKAFNQRRKGGGSLGISAGLLTLEDESDGGGDDGEEEEEDTDDERQDEPLSENEA